MAGGCQDDDAPEKRGGMARRIWTEFLLVFEVETEEWSERMGCLPLWARRLSLRARDFTVDEAIALERSIEPERPIWKGKRIDCSLDVMERDRGEGR